MTVIKSGMIEVSGCKSSEEIGELIASALKKSGGIIGDATADKKKTPLCIVDDHPELVEMFEVSTKKAIDFASRLDAIEAERKIARDEHWGSIMKTLLSKGLITQKEFDLDIDIARMDGVLFKFEDPQHTAVTEDKTAP